MIDEPAARSALTESTGRRLPMAAANGDVCFIGTRIGSGVCLHIGETTHIREG